MKKEKHPLKLFQDPALNWEVHLIPGIYSSKYSIKYKFQTKSKIVLNNFSFFNLFLYIFPWNLCTYLCTPNTHTHTCIYFWYAQQCAKIKRMIFTKVWAIHLSIYESIWMHSNVKKWRNPVYCSWSTNNPPLLSFYLCLFLFLCLF